VIRQRFGLLLAAAAAAFGFGARGAAAVSPPPPSPLAKMGRDHRIVPPARPFTYSRGRAVSAAEQKRRSAKRRRVLREKARARGRRR